MHVTESMKAEGRRVIASRSVHGSASHVEWILNVAVKVAKAQGLTLHRAVNYVFPPIVALVVVCMMTPRAQAYPENVRFGYPSCAACHNNGSGGGLVTPYGRAAAAQVSATWSGEHEGDVLHGAFGADAMPEWLLVDANARSVNLNAEVNGVKSHRKFIMAAEGEVGLRPFKGLWLVGSAGVYGPEQRREYRRHFIQADLCEHASVRIGRFMPVYGVGFDDHTFASRSRLGFGEGREAYASEASVRSRYGEITATQTYGDAGLLAMNGATGGEYMTRAETMTLAKAGAFIGDSAQAGVSGLHAVAQDSVREAWGAYAIVAPAEWAYLMADWNRMQSSAAPAQVIGTTVLGVQPVRGLTIAATHEAVQGEHAVYGAQLRYVPRPHFEFMARIKRQGDGLASVLMTHYWL